MPSSQITSRLGWFGHVMQVREERITKKMQHTKMEGKLPRRRSN